MVICQDIQVDLDEMGNGTIEPSDLLFVYPEYLVYDANMSGWGPAGACGGRRKGSTTDLESFTWEDQLSSLAGVTSIEIEISMQWSETSNVYPYSLNGDVLGSEFGVGPGGCWIQVKTIELDLSSYNVGGTNTFTWDLPADDHALIMNSAWGDAFARVVIHGDSPGLSDNCSDVGSINLTASTTTFSCSEVGTQEVTLEATDANGNTSNCTSIVTVEDNIPPVVICQNITVELDEAGNGSTTAALVDDNSNDACGIASLTLDNEDFSCDDVGNGNSVTLMVEDNKDICSGVTITYSEVSDNAPCVETITRTWVATDDCGNSSTCEQTITVEDTTAPVIIAGTDGSSECQGMSADANTDYIAWLANNAGATATDDCNNITWSNTPGTWSGGCVNIITVTFTATDDCGNTSTTSASFTIEDTTAPVITCPADITLDCSDDLTDYTVTGEATATDICSGVTITYSEVSDNAPCVETITRTWVATDDCGNSSTCEQTITVEDTTAPVIIAGTDGSSECQGMSADANTDYIAWLANNAGATATDDCNNITWSNTPGVWSGGCVNIITVTFTATDDCGNTSTTSASFTIEDTTVPTIDVAASMKLSSVTEPEIRLH